MIRAIFSAIAGYALMVIVVLSCIAATWFTLGNRFAFEGESRTASLGWSVIQLLAGGLGAIAGGALAAWLAGPKHALAIRILTGMILVLGILNAVLSLGITPPPLPEGKALDSLSFSEAGQYARSPTWYLFAIVIAGVAGIGMGGRLASTKQSTQPAP
jgi:hypothetical protein